MIGALHILYSILTIYLQPHIILLCLCICDFSLPPSTLFPNSSCSPFQTPQCITVSRRPCLSPCLQFISGFEGSSHLSKNIVHICIMVDTISVTWCVLHCCARHGFVSLTSKTITSGWAVILPWAPFTQYSTCTIVWVRPAFSVPDRDYHYSPMQNTLPRPNAEQTHTHIANTCLMNEKNEQSTKL